MLFSSSQDSADETNGSPIHNNGDGGDADTTRSLSDAGTPPKENNSSLGAATPTTTSIPLGDNSLLVDISDALSEKDKVKFTVHTRTTLPGYAKDDFFVVRQHEEFVWLHDRFEENEEYAGYIVSVLKVIFARGSSLTFSLQIPPCPPKPDFDASREKLQRLGEGEGNMTKEEFKKMKQELEA